MKNTNQLQKYHSHTIVSTSSHQHSGVTSISGNHSHSINMSGFRSPEEDAKIILKFLDGYRSSHSTSLNVFIFMNDISPSLFNFLSSVYGMDGKDFLESFPSPSYTHTSHRYMLKPEKVDELRMLVEAYLM